jgi:hypothetical protein
MCKITRPVLACVLAGSATLVLSGCGPSGLFNRIRPDEFAVQRQPPLVVPPDFALTPPQPGAPRPATRTSQQQALDALFGGPAPRSNVEQAAVGHAGTPEPSIRSTVADPKTSTANKSDVTRDILNAPSGDGREAQAHTGN